MFKLWNGADAPMPLTWWPDAQRGEIRVYVKDPKGHILCLDHTIASTGHVSPGLECTRCGYRARIVLHGWLG